MDNVLIESIGYLAAVVINFSAYPQARKVQLIIVSKDYNRLTSISIPMYSLQTAGCILWFIYAVLSNVYPIIFGSIMCFIPSVYILGNITYYKPKLLTQQPENNDTNIENQTHEI